MKLILAEGRYLHTVENQQLCGSLEGIQKAKAEGIILEGIALNCQEGLGMTVSLGAFTGFIPWFQGALGLDDGTVRDIAFMSRVGRPVAVIVTEILEEEGNITLILSRKLAQYYAKQHIMALPNGTVLSATVTRLENFGAFVDVGCGIASLLSIDRISISRISHPSQRFFSGQEIYVIILDHDWNEERIRVSHRELLGTWEENAKRFAVGMTLPAIVRSIKPYGTFVELSPNFSGLAEPTEGLYTGQRVSVYIKAILPQRRKCKLLVIGSLPDTDNFQMEYVLPEKGSLTHWQYTPEDNGKSETIFY